MMIRYLSSFFVQVGYETNNCAQLAFLMVPTRNRNRNFIKYTILACDNSIWLKVFDFLRPMTTLELWKKVHWRISKNRVQFYSMTNLKIAKLRLHFVHLKMHRTFYKLDFARTSQLATSHHNLQRCGCTSQFRLCYFHVQLAEKNL